METTESTEKKCIDSYEAMKSNAKIIAKYINSYEAMKRFERAYEEFPSNLTRRNFINSTDLVRIITPNEILKELGTSKEDLEKKIEEAKSHKID